MFGLSLGRMGNLGWRGKFASSSLNLNFVSSSQVLDPRITFTRASNATRVNSSGLIETVANNAPRFDYDPVTLAPKGLLIEEQRTNLLTYSEQFDNAGWTKASSSISATKVSAPDGSLTGQKLFEDTTNNQHHVRTAHTTTNSTITLSVYAKASERSFVFLQLSNNATGAAGVLFNLTSGTAQSASNGGDFTNSSASITSVGNGWYRCSLTTTKGSVNNAAWPYITVSNGGVIYQGDGTSGIYIWGAQLEQGAFPTSYIPTTAAAATRAADVAVMTGANFSSWYRQDEGTLFAEAVVNGSKPNSAFVRVQNAGLTEYIQMRQNAGGAQVLAQVVSAGGSTPGLAQSNYVVGTPFKLALANKSADTAASFNGAAASTSNASTTVPVVDRLHLYDAGAYYLRRIAYFPRRLSNAELQSITS